MGEIVQKSLKGIPGRTCEDIRAETPERIAEYTLRETPRQHLRNILEKTPVEIMRKIPISIEAVP